MFFATSPASEQLADILLDEWRGLAQSDPRLRLRALIDQLLVPDIVSLCHQLGWPSPTAVYDGHPGYNSGNSVSPCVLELPDPVTHGTHGLHALVAHCSGIPALGFLASPHDLPILKAQLMRMAGIADDSGQRWILRFADTRVWPPEFEWLSTEQHRYVFAGIAAWWIVNRHGQLQMFDGQPDAAPAQRDEFAVDFRVTEHQLIRLLDKGEADQHLARMAASPSHSAVTRHPIEQYDVVQKALASLDRMHIDDLQQRFVYARFAVHFAGDCEDDLTVQQALLSASQSDTPLSDLLPGLSG